MATIAAVITEDARKYWPQLFGQMWNPSSTTVAATSDWNPGIFTFRVGSGGWVNYGAGPVPRTPDANLRYPTGIGPLSGLQDLDCLIDPQRPTGEQRYSTVNWAQYAYEKELTSDKFEIDPLNPKTLKINAVLEAGEANNDPGSGTYPQLFEIAVYSDHPLHNRVAALNDIVPITNVPPRLMVAYGTFAREIKDSSKKLSFEILLNF